ncbi:MAG: NAD(P)-binding protein [Candidatus Competibacteraceae bacterium]|nr:NAD(P)-binding protein [Candidatus Competibacteraceae bacterium]
MTVAVIGAGLAGLTCAGRLAEAGLEVRLFDKGRGAGGRLSTRRVEPWNFDHGAQYLTARDPAFKAQMARWREMGVVSPWPARLVECNPDRPCIPWRDGRERFVGVPGMSAVVRQAAQGLDLRFNVQVQPPRREEGGWRLLDTAGHVLGLFHQVVVAAPAPQSGELLAAAPALVERIRQVRMMSCWSVMLGFREALALDFDGAFVRGSPLAWAARNSSKPARPVAEAWVLQASGSWSEQHLDSPGERVAAELLGAFGKATGLASLAPASRISHRWRYAAPVSPLGEAYLYDSQLGIGACGDWCLAPRIEAAWLSGRALAGRLLEE